MDVVEVEDTRTRLLSTALRLFTEHGVEGTSLQMIAAALGVTKAAVYYHFKTKAEIIEAVAEPGLRELQGIVDDARAQRTRGAQIDHLLDGFVDVVVRHRALVALFSSDPGIARAVEKSLNSAESFTHGMMEILVGPEPDISAIVTAHAMLAGVAMAGGSPEAAALDGETLHETLVNVGRKLYNRPRRRG